MRKKQIRQNKISPILGKALRIPKVTSTKDLLISDSNLSLEYQILNESDGFTILVPLKDEFKNINSNLVRVKNSAGGMIPAVCRRLNSKYLHVDISPASTTSHKVVLDANSQNFSNDFDYNETSSFISVDNGFIYAKFNKTGSLISSLKINNQEQLTSALDFKIQNPNQTLSITEATVELNNLIFFRVRQKATYNNVEFLFFWTLTRDRSFLKCDVLITNSGLGGWLNGTKEPFNFDKLYFEFSSINSLTETLVSANSTQNDTQIINEVSYAKIGSDSTFAVAFSDFYQSFPAKLTATGNNYNAYLIDGTSQSLEGKKQKRYRIFFGRYINDAPKYFTNPSYTINNQYMLEFLSVNPSNRTVGSLLPSGFADITTPQNGIDRMLGSGYDVDASQTFNQYTKKSIKEWRETNIELNFGWKNYGDLMWDNGLSGQYNNLHYDIPAILLKEWLRTNHTKAYKYGVECANFRGTMGQVHGDEHFQGNTSDNLNGLGLYEKNDHNGSSVVQPAQSHNWIEGIWLYYLITGDHIAYINVVLAAQRVLGFTQYNIDFAIGSNNGRFLGWNVYNLVNSYLYTDDYSYISKAYDLVNQFIDAEISAGSKGYFVTGSTGPSDDNIQIFSYAGYTLIGFAMLHRLFPTNKLRDFIIRVATWLTQSTNPPLVGGDTNISGQYRNLGSRYFWRADNTYAVDDYSNIAYGFEAMPLLVEAFRITGNVLYKEKAKNLYKDLAYYRDYAFEGTADGYHDPNNRALINLNSLLYAGSAIKVWAQSSIFVQAVQSFMKDEVF